MIYMDDIKKFIIGFFIVAVVIAGIILAATVLGYDGVNSAEDVRYANLLQNRETVEKAIMTYKAGLESKSLANTSSLEILTENKGYLLIDEDSEVIKVEGKNLELYKLSREKYKKRVGQDYFEESSVTDRFYITSSGNLYVVFDTYKDIPRWIRKILEKGSENEIESLNRFIIILDESSISNGE